MTSQITLRHFGGLDTDLDKIRALKGFIIKNFIIILLIVAVTESLMILLLNNLLLPRVSQFLFDGKGIVEYDVRTVFVYFLYLLFRGAVLFISRYIPLGIGGLDDKLINSVSLFKGNILVDNYESIGFWTKVFLLGMIIVMLIFLIAPVFIGGVVYTGRVIARFSKLEKEENERKDQYEKKRNLMLSDIAHDLRTPITTIYGYSQAILDGKAGEDKRDEYLNLICMKSKKVDELINLLFDYVKIDSEGFVLHKEKTDIAELARQAGALMYQDIIDTGMELFVQIPEDAVLEAAADKVQLSRVITNLISNAVKHNPKGTRIGLFLADNVFSWSLYVADDGAEIEPAMAENLFEPFKTGDSSRTSGGGTGLGLSIARKITEMHGFKLSLLQGKELPSDVKSDGFTKCFEIRILDKSQ